ncbi:MAG: hypothetical protein M3159_05040 [Actinomycetota bacterium]|nr:hypothetical protein [Actinomycetota bacterium]
MNTSLKSTSLKPAPLKCRKALVAAAVTAAALLTAACGGSDSKSTNASATTVTSSAAAATTVVDSSKPTDTGNLSAAFDHIAGYELAELPASDLQSARDQYQSEVSGNAAAQKAVSDINGRLVSKEGAKVAVVLAMSFSPDASTQPGFQAAFVEGAAGSDASPVTLSGEDAKTFTQSDGTEGVVFAKGRLGLLVIGAGGNSTQLQDVMSKLIGNNA